MFYPFWSPITRYWVTAAETPVRRRQNETTIFNGNVVHGRGDVLGGTNDGIRPVQELSRRHEDRADARFGAIRRAGKGRSVEVAHSFILSSSHFDCIAIGQQPTVTAFGIKTIAQAPPQSLIAKSSTAAGATGNVPQAATQAVDQKKSDAFGNSIGCEQGTIPMRRITLDEMSHYSTLREFFQKGPNGAGRPSTHGVKSEAPAAATPAHKYSVMYQNVDNLGGNSSLNIWNPDVNTGYGEVFSLSQQWYVGGSGAGEQTAEVGWQNYPAKYGSEDSRLFTYWTADGYNRTGCYNLDCAAFVQIANQGILGGGFTETSSLGGPQYEFSAQYQLFEGNWWLSIQGTWIGYYPGGVYQGGQLTQYAQAIEFGTEGVGTTIWPAEGSGYWSTSNFGLAAYQRTVYYIDLNGNGIWATLQHEDPSPGCYSTTGTFFDSSSSWGVYFFEGGPGGSGC
jgi:hypothetical protein